MFKLIQNKCNDNILSIELDKSFKLYLVIYYHVYDVTSIIDIGSFDEPNFDRINLFIKIDNYDSYNWKYLNIKNLSIHDAFYIIHNDKLMIRKIKLWKIYER